MEYLKIIRNYVIAAGILTVLFRNVLQFPPLYAFLWWLFAFSLFGAVISAFEKLFELKYPNFKIIGVGVGLFVGGVIVALVFRFIT